jgi:hypothetical protein
MVTKLQPAVSHLGNADTMGERIGRIGRIRTDFFLSFRRKRSKLQKIPTE